MTSLERALLKIARFLKAKRIPYMVIGGVANLFWGIPRTTLDIDITIQVKEKTYASLIHGLKGKFRLRIKNPLAFIAKTNVLPLEDISGVRIDVIFAKIPYEFRAIQRSKPVRIRGETVRICSPEDLIIHKIISDRPRDRQDVCGIIGSLGIKLNRRYLDPILKDLAKMLAKPELLRFYRGCFHKI